MFRIYEYNALRNNRNNAIYNIRHIHTSLCSYVTQPYCQNCVIPPLTVFVPPIRMSILYTSQWSITTLRTLWYTDDRLDILI